MSNLKPACQSGKQESHNAWNQKLNKIARTSCFSFYKLNAQFKRTHLLPTSVRSKLSISLTEFLSFLLKQQPKLAEWKWEKASPGRHSRCIFHLKKQGKKCEERRVPERKNNLLVKHCRFISHTQIYMGVSKNRRNPQIHGILMGFSIINHPFWGTPFLETPIYIYHMAYSILLQSLNPYVWSHLCGVIEIQSQRYSII